jgi:hypothetical protein
MNRDRNLKDGDTSWWSNPDQDIIIVAVSGAGRSHAGSPWHSDAPHWGLDSGGRDILASAQGQPPINRASVHAAATRCSF